MKIFFGRLLSWLCPLLAALGISACDAYKLHQLEVGVSTAADVRAQFGEPEMSWNNADGSQTWEFSRQPAGTECFMITLGSDNILRRIEQVLSEENFARIRSGMSGDEVRRVLGKPARHTPLELKGEMMWEWRIDNNVGNSGDAAYFTVNFNQDGRVTHSGRRIQHQP